MAPLLQRARRSRAPPCTCSFSQCRRRNTGINQIEPFGQCGGGDFNPDDPTDERPGPRNGRRRRCPLRQECRVQVRANGDINPFFSQARPSRHAVARSAELDGGTVGPDAAPRCAVRPVRAHHQHGADGASVVRRVFAVEHSLRRQTGHVTTRAAVSTSWERHGLVVLWATRRCRNASSASLFCRPGHRGWLRRWQERLGLFCVVLRNQRCNYKS